MMKHRMRLLWISMVLLIALLCCTWLWIFLHKDEIKQYAIAEINSNLHTRVNVKEIKLDLWSHFPKISLSFEDVLVYDAFASDTPLARVGYAYAAFNVWDILMKRYQITMIALDDAHIRITYDRKGNPNYAIFNSSTDTSVTPLTLKKIKLTNTRLDIYQPYSKSQAEWSQFINSGECMLDIQAKEVRLGIQVNSKLVFVKFNRKIWLKDKQFDIQAQLAYANNRMHIDVPTLNLEHFACHLKGVYIWHGKSDEVDISIGTNKTDIAMLLSLLPVKPQAVSEWTSNGKVTISGSIKGYWSAKQMPETKLFLKVENGSMYRKSDNLKVDRIHTDAIVYAGNTQSFLELKGLSFMLNESVVKSDLTIRDFNKPHVSANVNVRAHAQDMATLFQWEYPEATTGLAELNLEISGLWEELLKKQHSSLAALSGSITWDIKNIQLAGVPIILTHTKGNIDIAHSWKLTDVQLHTPKTHITINGTLNQFIGYLFASQPLLADIYLKADRIKIEEWMGLSEGSNKKSNSYKLLIHGQVEQLLFDSITATQVSGIVSVTPDFIELTSLSANVFDGNVTGSTQCFLKPEGYVLSHDVKFQSVDVRKLFEQCHNFYQSELTSQHIQGKISGAVQMGTYWDTTWNTDYSKLRAIVDVELKDGKITGYKPLLSLSRFADVKDLENLQIDAMKTGILISDKKINISETHVANNALNISISGYYNFDGYMDYKIKVKLSELLMGKTDKKADQDYEEEAENGKGMYIYLTMKGTRDNLDISYDKKAVKQKMKQDLKAEKNTIRNLMQQEFGIQKEQQAKEKETDSEEVEFEVE